MEADGRVSYSDDTPMPWGRYKGTKLANVPARYLLWLYNNHKCKGPLLAYIRNNMDCLKLEMHDR